MVQIPNLNNSNKSLTSLSAPKSGALKIDIKTVTDFFRPAEGTGGAPTKLLIGSFLFTLASILIYLGLNFGYQAFLSSRISATDQQLEQLSGSVPKADQEKIIAFYSQLVNFQKILDNHVKVSQVFSKLEKLTSQRVFFAGLDLGVKYGRLNLNGAAASYSVLGEQLNAFANDPLIENYALHQAQSSGGQISFNVLITLKKGIFK